MHFKLFRLLLTQQNKTLSPVQFCWAQSDKVGGFVPTKLRFEVEKDGNVSINDYWRIIGRVWAVIPLKEHKFF